MASKGRIEGYLVLTLEFSWKDKQWNGVCRQLGTATCGSDIEEVRDALRELVPQHVELLQESGELDRFLRRWKIPVRKTRPRGYVTLDTPRVRSLYQVLVVPIRRRAPAEATSRFKPSPEAAR